MSRSRSARGRNRSPRPNPAKRLELLVFTEGTTEDIYLNSWHRRFRDHVTLKVAECSYSSPLQIVQLAANTKRNDERDARKNRGDAYDEYWAVFDVDSHPNLDEAIQLAGRTGVLVALSNPCFEIWLDLHFSDQTAYIERADVQRRTREHLGCDKRLTDSALSVLADAYPIARDRAKQLTEKHLGDGSPPNANPSSDIWKLTERARLGRLPDE